MEDVFKIDSPQKADWAIEKIKTAQQRYDIFIQVLDTKKQELKEQEEEAKKTLESETSFLIEKLGKYIETLPCKETKTQKSFTFPAGKVIKKYPKYKFDYDEKGLIAQLENTEFVESIQKLKWETLKKKIGMAENGKIFLEETGEILDAVKVVEESEKVVIK